MKLNFRNLTQRVRHLRYGSRPKAARDWFVLLGVGAGLLLLSITSNLWYFSRVTTGEQIGTATSTPLLQGVDLVPVEELFEERALERNRYLNEYGFVDPSR